PLFERAVLLAQLRRVRFEAVTVLRELRGHVVEGRREHRKLIVRDSVNAVRKVSGGDLARCFRERAYGRAYAARQMYRAPRRREEQHQGEQPERRESEQAHAPLLLSELLEGLCSGRELAEVRVGPTLLRGEEAAAAAQINHDVV